MHAVLMEASWPLSWMMMPLPPPSGSVDGRESTLGTHAGAVGRKHLQAYLDEYGLPPQPAPHQRRRPEWMLTVRAPAGAAGREAFAGTRACGPDGHSGPK